MAQGTMFELVRGNDQEEQRGLCCCCEAMWSWLTLTGSKRASKEPAEFEKPGEGMDPKAAMAGMTEEQKKFLAWYYRTEDRK